MDNREPGKLAALSDEKKKARDPANPNSVQYKKACQKAKKAAQKLMNDWRAHKVETIQQMIDSKDHNYQLAGYKELRSILHKGASVKLRDAKGNLAVYQGGEGSQVAGVLLGVTECSS